jgi:hypothetical protein
LDILHKQVPGKHIWAYSLQKHSPTHRNKFHYAAVVPHPAADLVGSSSRSRYRRVSAMVDTRPPPSFPPSLSLSFMFRHIAHSLPRSLAYRRRCRDDVVHVIIHPAVTTKSRGAWWSWNMGNPRRLSPQIPFSNPSIPSCT